MSFRRSSLSIGSCEPQLMLQLTNFPCKPQLIFSLGGLYKCMYWVQAIVESHWHSLSCSWCQQCRQFASAFLTLVQSWLYSGWLTPPFSSSHCHLTSTVLAHPAQGEDPQNAKNRGANLNGMFHLRAMYKASPEQGCTAKMLTQHQQTYLKQTISVTII